ncbi:hypothetical protein E2C01_039651 [Portunus trituberculatus]|uniref:Uncharacterized protein n=1 Tax=Portunus trituberculatus TaxID=210409 RepID=A0A5B7FKE4_PORTR|nr:hypothetical protein [Portunus trituberculatus]
MVCRRTVKWEQGEEWEQGAGASDFGTRSCMEATTTPHPLLYSNPVYGEGRGGGGGRGGGRETDEAAKVKSGVRRALMEGVGKASPGCVTHYSEHRACPELICLGAEKLDCVGLRSFTLTNGCREGGSDLCNPFGAFCLPVSGVRGSESLHNNLAIQRPDR